MSELDDRYTGNSAAYCQHCRQMELEYVELMNQYDALKKDYDKAQETIGELQRQVKLYSGSY